MLCRQAAASACEMPGVQCRIGLVTSATKGTGLKSTCALEPWHCGAPSVRPRTQAGV
jgi:hypothetical protein